MSPADVARLTAAVRRLRRRLWLADLPRPLASGLWSSALLLAGASLLRWHLGWPGPVWLSVLVLTPITAALLLVLSRRPDMERAIRTADRLAKAGDLLLTTWDLVAARRSPAEEKGQAQRQLPDTFADCGIGNAMPQTSNPHSAIRTPQSAAAVVLDRASRALSGWLERLRGSAPHVDIRCLWPPLTGLLAAVPLLALAPPGPVPGGTLSSPTVRPAATPATDTPPSPLAALVEELRLGPAGPPPPAPGSLTPSRDGRSREGDGSPMPRAEASGAPMAADSSATSSPTPSARAPAQNAGDEVSGRLPAETGSAHAANVGRDAAGGTGAETGGGDTDLAPPASPLHTAGIARHGQPRETAAAAGKELAPEAATSTQMPAPIAAPAVLPPGLSAAGLDLDPARRMIAARYLELMQDDPE